MKFIATSDFANVTGIELDDAKHPRHIHKGAQFSIGGDLPLEKLSAAEKKLVAELNAAGRVVDVNDKAKVEAIKAEVAAETKKAKPADPAPPK